MFSSFSVWQACASLWVFKCACSRAIRKRPLGIYSTCVTVRKRQRVNTELVFKSCAYVHACVLNACRLSAQLRPDFLHRASMRAGCLSLRIKKHPFFSHYVSLATSHPGSCWVKRQFGIQQFIAELHPRRVSSPCSANWVTSCAAKNLFVISSNWGVLARGDLFAASAYKGGVSSTCVSWSSFTFFSLFVCFKGDRYNSLESQKSVQIYF